MTWIDSRTSAQTCLGQSKRLFGQTDRAFKGPVLSEDQSVRVSNQPERDPGGNRTPDEKHQFFNWSRAEELEDLVQALWDRSDVVEVAQ